MEVHFTFSHALTLTLAPPIPSQFSRLMGDSSGALSTTVVKLGAFCKRNDSSALPAVASHSASPRSSSL